MSHLLNGMLLGTRTENKTFIQKMQSLKPLAYYPLNETAGTVAKDYSGNGYNGAYGTPVTLGQTKSPFIAPYFNGTSGSSSASVNLLTSGLQTVFPWPVGSVVGWVWLDFDLPAVDTNDYYPFYARQFSTEVRLMFFDPNGGSGAGRSWGTATVNGTNKTPFMQGAVNKTGWHLIGHSWDCAGGSYRFNFDKTFFNDQSGVLTPLTNAVNVLSIGAGNGNGVGLFKGWISNFMVFNTVLTQANYNYIYSLPTL